MTDLPIIVVEPLKLADIAEQIRLLDQCTGCHTPRDVAEHAAQSVVDFITRALPAEARDDFIRRVRDARSLNAAIAADRITNGGRQ